MNTTTSFIADVSTSNRRIFDTPDACIRAEFNALRQELAHAAQFLTLADGVPIDPQIARLADIAKQLRAKAAEWHAVRAERQPEFAQRAAADLLAQEHYWAQFYANQDKIARAINRDMARREQRRAEPAAPAEPLEETPAPPVRPEPVEGNVTRPVCEVCGRTMVRRVNRTNRSAFLACSGYPACKHTKPLAEPAETPAENPVEMLRAA